MRTVPILLMIPAAAAFAQVPVTLEEARQRCLEALDEGRPLPSPEVVPADAAGLRWLMSGFREGLPANPFPRGGAAWREAQAFRRLLGLPASALPEALGRLTLDQPGTRVALWTWGQGRTRRGTLPPTARKAFEDRLLERSSPALLREFALRHALCLCLDEGDEARFGALKAVWEAENAPVFLQFQRAFGLLGSSLPLLRLWRLPGLSLQEVLLSAPGREVHVRPWQSPPPDLPAGSVWVVPTDRGSLPAGSTALTGPTLEEAQVLSDRVQDAGRSALLAPSRESMEALGFLYFPLVIRHDAQGRIRRISMGDAALVSPAPPPAGGR